MYLRRSLVATTVLPLLALAACQGDPEPEPTPITAEPTATEAPTSQATEEPAGEYEEGSPEAFIVEWQAAADEFQRTGNPADFEKLNKDCRQCDDFVERILETYRSGGRVEYGESEILAIRQRGSSTQFEVEAKWPASAVYDGSGKKLRSYEASRSAILVTIVKVRDGWRVAAQNLV